MAGSVEQVQRAFTAYTVERELGSGGMATVYLAHDKKHDRKVAIKILHDELAAVLGVERFLHEIRVTANLQHPHILGLIDSGIIGSRSSRQSRGSELRAVSFSSKFRAGSFGKLKKGFDAGLERPSELQRQDRRRYEHGILDGIDRFP